MVKDNLKIIKTFATGDEQNTEEMKRILFDVYELIYQEIMKNGK